ncbi:MAG: histidine phosphatase family protein [Rhodospirillales bacterium]|jgi:probable phosphoglycerate mutase|nr:histidine phosphatase family protein [Rhodospirillales bacterium]MDP6643770.1 histidine phosphatase family protein [Rhodospirillales bacterium]MDP6843904.1 histidine phosphatase family protein [Rhodospirillales bacterium]
MLTARPFVFVRHGETDRNRQNIAQGQTDVPLNASGRDQARKAGGMVKDIEIATICVSPLLRARQTADIIAEVLPRPITVIDGLAECALGEREGEFKGQWWTDWLAGRATPAGAETYSAFVERALIGVNKALEQPGPVLIVAHGGIYWSIQKHAPVGDDRALGNATPVLHLPPQADFPGWTVHALDD